MEELIQGNVVAENYKKKPIQELVEVCRMKYVRGESDKGRQYWIEK
jgi:hypothetical protein